MFRPTDKPTVLMTINEVANECRVSTRTVQRWINDDQLPTLRLPGRGGRAVTRIASDDLGRWLERFISDGEPGEHGDTTPIRLEGRRFFPDRET